MKKFFMKALAVSALVLAVSCGNDDDTPTTSDDDGGVDLGTGTVTTLADGTVLLNGTFLNQEVSLTNDAIARLEGIVIFGEGATLNIEAGTIVKGNLGSSTNASALVIARDAQIFASGTSTSPVIFTTLEDEIAIGETESTLGVSDATRGLWGGVVVLGNAPISAGGNAIAGTDGAEAQIEGISDNIEEGRYGGDVSDDNSGELTYISIRYAGTDIATDNELNGLTLGGVGSATTIDYVEIYAGFDDGVEFFGGSVDASNIIVNGQGDDAVDADQGYSGTVSNVLVISNDSNSGFELDGPEADLLSDSSFTIEDATLIGPSNARIAELKSGVAATISNVLAYNYTTEEIQINGSGAYTNFTGGATTLSNWQIVDTRMASAIVTSDEATDVDSSFLSVVATGTVGADTSVFSGWSQSSILGDF